MRIRTHAVAVASATALALVSACASTTTPAPVGANNLELAALRQQQQDQTRRIAELETRLSLLEADARSSRDADESPLRAGESLRIGGGSTVPTLTSSVSSSDH